MIDFHQFVIFICILISSLYCYLQTLTLQTILDIQRVDINARAIFCGEQVKKNKEKLEEKKNFYFKDCRLNELRRITGAIIDLNVVQGTRRPFERVNWTVSHRNIEIRDFVVRRLNYWKEQTQIACDIAYDDAVFLQEQCDHIQLYFLFKFIFYFL